MKRQGEYGSVREGACVEEVEKYFSEAPPPEGLSAARARVDAFVRVHQAVGRPIVLVTAGRAVGCDTSCGIVASMEVVQVGRRSLWR